MAGGTTTPTKARITKILFITNVIFEVEVVKIDKADAELRRGLINKQFKWIV